MTPLRSAPMLNVLLEQIACRNDSLKQVLTSQSEHQNELRRTG